MEGLKFPANESGSQLQEENSIAGPAVTHDDFLLLSLGKNCHNFSGGL